MTCRFGVGSMDSTAVPSRRVRRRRARVRRTAGGGVAGSRIGRAVPSRWPRAGPESPEASAPRTSLHARARTREREAAPRGRPPSSPWCDGLIVRCSTQLSYDPLSRERADGIRTHDPRVPGKRPGVAHQASSSPGSATWTHVPRGREAGERRTRGRARRRTGIEPAAPEEGLEPSPQRFKLADPRHWTTPEIWKTRDDWRAQGSRSARRMSRIGIATSTMPTAQRTRSTASPEALARGMKA